MISRTCRERSWLRAAWPRPFLACAGVLLAAVSIAGAPVPFTTLAKGDTSNIEERREVVVRTPAEWKALWTQHAPDHPLPEVDFAKSMVVGIFLGYRATGGYVVEITSVEQDGGKIVVTWREERPGRRDVVTQMLTFPYHLVTIDRSDARVTFTKAEG